MPAASSPAPLADVRVLSLALNLPGPAALMRCRALGADCVKVEPPAGDPMHHYNPAAYGALHAGIAVQTIDLKQAAGRDRLDAELAHTDVLITSFRPSALAKLGLDADALRSRHPRLSCVAIVGAPGPGAEAPGHDLTYLAEAGLITHIQLPPTLYADMAGALMVVEAVLGAVLQSRAGGGNGAGTYQEIALQGAAQWLALPRTWGLTLPDAAVGGAHAGYRVYRCADGRVAVAALEPHFAARLCEVAGVRGADPAAEATHHAVGTWLGSQTCAALEALGRARDIPLHTMADPAAPAG